MNEADMGDDFAEWAAVYFSEEGGNLNTEIVISAAYRDFINDSETNEKNWNTKRFNKALKAFCENKSYTLNPSEKCNAGGHITKWVDGKSQRMLYVKTK